MKFSASLVLAAAVGAYAYPSAHAHMKAHRSLQERDVEFVKSVRPTRAPTNSGSNDGSNSGSNGAVGTFCNGNSGTFVPPAGSDAAKCLEGGSTKRATAYDICSVGNLGSATDYGCNLKQINAGDVDSYDHTVTLENASSESQTCGCFLKISKLGGIDGFWNGNQVFDVTIPAGESAYVAADANTQGGCACGPGSSPPVATNSGGQDGQLAGTWVEFDFSSEKNTLHSGADASNLVASKLGLPFPAMRITSPDCNTVSYINADGSGDNSFRKGMEYENGLGFNQNPGPFSINVKLS